jgi:hypothetical protein
MLRNSKEHIAASDKLGKLSERVLTKLQLQCQDIKDELHYYPTMFSFYIPPGFHQEMEISSVEISFGKWDKEKHAQQYSFLADELYVNMKFAIPSTAEEWAALEEKVIETARTFLK